MNVKPCIFLLFAIMPGLSSAMDADMQLQMTNAQIERLERELADKYADLKKCEKNTKGFKIAGITTLATTGVGIAVNIGLNKKMNDTSGGIASGEVKGVAADTRSAEQISSDNQDIFAEFGL